jgi:hypothetical protein
MAALTDDHRARGADTGPRLECGHAYHIGTCPSCQRTQLRRLAAQNEAAVAAGRRWSGSRR